MEPNWLEFSSRLWNDETAIRSAFQGRFQGSNGKWIFPAVLINVWRFASRLFFLLLLFCRCCCCAVIACATEFRRPAGETRRSGGRALGCRPLMSLCEFYSTLSISFFSFFFLQILLIYSFFFFSCCCFLFLFELMFHVLALPLWSTWSEREIVQKTTMSRS